MLSKVLIDLYIYHIAFSLKLNLVSQKELHVTVFALVI